MHICLFEDAGIEHLRPLVDLRPAYDLRTGIHTNLERAAAVFPDAGIILHMRKILSTAVRERHHAPVNHVPGALNVLFLNGRLLLEEGDFLSQLKSVVDKKEARVFTQEGAVLAAYVPRSRINISVEDFLDEQTFEGIPGEEVEGVRVIDRTWDLLNHMHAMITSDYGRLTRGFNILERPGADIHDSVILENPDRIHIAPGARVMAGTVISATDGPVCIDEHAVVMEGAVLRGPLYLGPYSQAKIHAHIDGGSYGTWVKLGGEVENTLIHSYSNKAHLGFLGDAYLGSWCNLGAGTNNSNLRNDYRETDLYNVSTREFERTGRQFTGLFMGDHAKCGIMTRFNTASVVGTYCNILGEGFQPRYIPAFSWGGSTVFQNYRIDKAVDVARAVLKRRNMTLSGAEEELLRLEYDRVTAARTTVIAI